MFLVSLLGWSFGVMVVISKTFPFYFTRLGENIQDLFFVKIFVQLFIECKDLFGIDFMVCYQQAIYKAKGNRRININCA